MYIRLCITTVFVAAYDDDGKEQSNLNKKYIQKHINRDLDRRLHRHIHIRSSDVPQEREKILRLVKMPDQKRKGGKRGIRCEN